MLNRLLEPCLIVLAAAFALNMAAKFIEPVAGTLLLIIAVAGGLVVTGFLVRLWWRWYRADRW